MKQNPNQRTGAITYSKTSCLRLTFSVIYFFYFCFRLDLRTVQAASQFRERRLLIAILAFQYSLSLCTSQTWFPVPSRCDLHARRVSVCFVFFPPILLKLVTNQGLYSHQSGNSSPVSPRIYYFARKTFLTFLFFPLTPPFLLSCSFWHLLLPPLFVN